eukprot:2410586-Pleurochrysis_carterae.AAC.2
MPSPRLRAQVRVESTPRWQSVRSKRARRGSTTSRRCATTTQRKWPAGSAHDTPCSLKLGRGEWECSRDLDSRLTSGDVTLICIVHLLVTVFKSPRFAWRMPAGIRSG